MSDTHLWSFGWAGFRCVAEIPASTGVDPRAWLPGFEPVRIAAEGRRGPTPQVVVREDDDDPGSTLEHAVVLHLLSQDRGRTHLHGAGAELPGGGAIVVLGPSGSGKSTLARAWSDLGLPIFGDDVLVLDEDGLRPFPRLLKVGGEEGDRLIDPADGGGWGRPGTPLRWILRLDWAAGADLDLSTCAPTEALQTLTRSLHATGAEPAASLDRLVRLVETTPMFAGVRGEAEATARRLIARIPEPSGDRPPWRGD